MASGAAQRKNCDIADGNVGCGYVAPASDTSSYGDTFNAVRGGVYAMQWDDEFIKVWHFDRESAPADIAAKKPQPDGWGRPQAVYGGKSCDVKSHFRDMSIVLNINFCGDYGNAVWASNGCTKLAPTCSEWVAKNPAAFANAYWDVNYIDAYVQSAAGPSSSNAAPSGVFPSFSPIAVADQPSSIQTASFTRLPGTAPSNNGTFTRFPVANNSSASMPNPTSPAAASSSASEPTTWTTRTSTNTSTVTVPGGGPIPTAKLPSPSGKPAQRANPANVDGFSYLGCFGSSSGFESFAKVADSADMDLDRCVDLCRGKKYAGVFDTACYCAAELDADTRVSMDTCDTACPGNSTQFCGGRVKSNGKFIGATANVTLPRTSSAASGGVPMPIATDGEYMPGNGANGTTGNPTRPEQPAPSGSGSPIAKGNSTAAPETPNVVKTGAKFNSTGPEILPAVSSLPASISSASGSTGSSSSIAPPTTAINRVAKSNSTGPEIPAPAPGSSSKTTSSDIPEVTIPVYPVEVKVKNATAPESTQQTSVSSSSSSSVAPASSAIASALFRNSTFVGRGVHGARWAMLKNARRDMPVRREAADFLLTVYAAVAKEEPPKQPPGMGIQTPRPSASVMPALDTSVGAGGSISTASSGSDNGNAAIISTASSGNDNGNVATSTTRTVVTTITYQTVHPSNPSKIVTEKYVTTIVKAHCGCTETPSPVMTVPMETKVVSCSACGHKGANTVTVTVPCADSIATPTASNMSPASHSVVPPASHSNIPPSSNGNASPSSNGQARPSSNGNDPAPSKGDNAVPSKGNNPAPSNGNVPPAANSNAPAASNGNAPAASSGNVPTVAPSTVPTVAGASGLKVTSLLCCTMLVMALLL